MARLLCPPLPLTLSAAAPEHGWTLMFADRHPFAGGPEHYAAYLEDADGSSLYLCSAADRILLSIPTGRRAGRASLNRSPLRLLRTPPEDRR